MSGKATENAMAGKSTICPVLQSYYNLPREEKEKHLKVPEVQTLLRELPPVVSSMLREGFLAGAHGDEIPGWKEVVVSYCMSHSRIIPALAKNPGTFTMLEKMYHFEPVEGPIDHYFLDSIPGGQALRNRYYTVTDKACEHVSQILQKNGSCLMIDIGSGPGRNGIDMCRKRPDFNGNIRIDCIDIDPEAIALGKKLVETNNVKQVEFVERSMTRLGDRYNGIVDYGLLIGILCGLTFVERVGLLVVLKPYFKPGGMLMAASLLDTMLMKGLFCAWFLREGTGWGLMYPALGELKKAFEAAGWFYQEYFMEEPTQLYEIGIGVNL